MKDGPKGPRGDWAWMALITIKLPGGWSLPTQVTVGTEWATDGTCPVGILIDFPPDLEPRIWPQLEAYLQQGWAAEEPSKSPGHTQAQPRLRIHIAPATPWSPLDLAARVCTLRSAINSPAVAIATTDIFVDSSAPILEAQGYLQVEDIALLVQDAAAISPRVWTVRTTASAARWAAVCKADTEGYPCRLRWRRSQNGGRAIAVDCQAPARRSLPEEDGPATVTLVPRGPINARGKELLGTILGELQTSCNLDLAQGRHRSLGVHQWAYVEGHFDSARPTALAIRLADNEEVKKVYARYHSKAICMGAETFAVEVRLSGNVSRRRV